MTDGRLEQAIELVQSGEKEKARELLELILKDDRNNISVWHWYAQTWSHKKDKVRVWEICLRYNPNNEQACAALQDLGHTQPARIEQKAKLPDTVRAGTRSTPWLLWASIGVLGVVAILAWSFVKASTPKDPQQYRHVQPVEYYLYVPDDYSAEAEWSLFVGIHGAGGSGLDCWNMWQTLAEKEGFILLCPSIPGGANGFYQDVGENTVWAAVNDMKQEYHVRPRMFFAGFSAGAFFIQGFTYHYPRAVSGLAILSSGLYLDPRVFPEVIPMTVVIGSADDPTAVQTSKQFSDDLNQYGFSVDYELLNGVGHTFTAAAQKSAIETFRKTVNK
jgi:poly(3-hydroxybutyrate) depolymerase